MPDLCTPVPGQSPTCVADIRPHTLLPTHPTPLAALPSTESLHSLGQVGPLLRLVPTNLFAILCCQEGQLIHISQLAFFPARTACICVSQALKPNAFVCCLQGLGAGHAKPFCSCSEQHSKPNNATVLVTCVRGCRLWCPRPRFLRLNLHSLPRT